MRVGIRREDKNEWERRVPLTPDHVRALVGEGIEFHVQPSRIRIFRDEEYVEAGAQVQEDLSGCDVVFAVKEMPADFFHQGQTYMFFSHTFKGQPYNMPMLRRILEHKATLLDYEKVTDEQNRRLIFFGNYAGTAGMLETFYTLGKRLEWEGTATPLADLKRPVHYPNLEAAKKALIEVGKRLVPVAPLVVGFTGYGNVSRGAQAIFDLISHQSIRPEDLKEGMQPGIYKVVFYEQDMFRPKEPGSPFELQDYYHHPEKYESDFERYLPHLTVLVNCIYWDARYPRLVTKQWLREAWSGPARPRLRVIGDISCDIEGSVECTVKATEPGDPIYTYLPSDGRVVDSLQGDGPVIMAVDTLPSELPREASTSFGDMLSPFVPAIAAADFKKPFEQLDLPPAVKRSVIVHRGEFTPDYKYMEKFVS